MRTAATPYRQDYLRLDGLTKHFGTTPVLDDLSLSVNEGEFVSIVGPSGCGKTTTLRIIAGFIQPDAGGIWLAGERIDQVASHKRSAAMVFQNYALFPHMTVFENVAFGPRMHKTPDKEVHARVGQALDLVRLGALGARYPRELSGGQQQRVALARAVVLNPRLLLLDEPLSNLDASLRKELREELRELQRASGLTTVLVTHDLEEAFVVSSRVAVMSNGRLEQFGTPAEIYTGPETRFVSSFVGHGNIVEGAVRSDGKGGAILCREGLEMRIPARSPRSTGRFSIPASAIRLSREPSREENSFPGVVEKVSFLGSIVSLQVRAAGLQLVCEAPCVGEFASLLPGDSIYLGWPMHSLIQLPD